MVLTGGVVWCQVLTGTDTAWKLVTAEDSGSRGSAPLLLQRVIQSAGYHLVVMAAILTNAYISSSVQFLHDGRSVTELYKDIYPIEVGPPPPQRDTQAQPHSDGQIPPARHTPVGGRSVCSHTPVGGPLRL